MQASSPLADTVVTSPNDLCHTDLNEFLIFLYWWTSQNTTQI
jgi:hypothetical protein